MTSKQHLAAANRTATRRTARDATSREDETQMPNAQERDDTRDAQARRPTRRCHRHGRYPATRPNRRRASRNRNRPTRLLRHRRPHHRTTQEEIKRLHHVYRTQSKPRRTPRGNTETPGVPSLTPFVYARPDANKPSIPPRTNPL